MTTKKISKVVFLIIFALAGVGLTLAVSGYKNESYLCVFSMSLFAIFYIYLLKRMQKKSVEEIETERAKNEHL